MKKLTNQNNLFSRTSEKSFKNQKKRIEKDNLKDLPLVLKSEATYQKKVIETIIKLKELFPKLYKKLIDIYSSHCSTDDLLFTEENRYNQFNRYDPTESSYQEVIDEFIMKTNKYTINANSKLADEVIVKIMRSMETDYEMV